MAVAIHSNCIIIALNVPASHHRWRVICQSLSLLQMSETIGDVVYGASAVIETVFAKCFTIGLTVT